MSLCELVRTHEMIRQLEHDRILPWLSDELKADGQAIGVEAAGHADGRQSEIIREDSEGGRERSRLSACLLYRKHGACERRQHERINVAERSIGNVLPIDVNRTQIVEIWNLSKMCASPKDTLANAGGCWCPSLKPSS